MKTSEPICRTHAMQQARKEFDIEKPKTGTSRRGKQIWVCIVIGLTEEANEIIEAQKIKGVKFLYRDALVQKGVCLIVRACQLMGITGDSVTTRIDRFKEGGGLWQDYLPVEDGRTKEHRTGILLEIGRGAPVKYYALGRWMPSEESGKHRRLHFWHTWHCNSFRMWLDNGERLPSEYPHADGRKLNLKNLTRYPKDGNEMNDVVVYASGERREAEEFCDYLNMAFRLKAGGLSKDTPFEVIELATETTYSRVSYEKH